MKDLERQNIVALRAQAADQQDTHAMHLLDLAEPLPDTEEHQRGVLISLAAFRLKGLGEAGARAMEDAGAEAMLRIVILHGILERES